MFKKNKKKTYLTQYLMKFFTHKGIKCSELDFRCSDNSGCIDKSLVCNGFRDCYDDSDEENCLYRNKRYFKSWQSEDELLPVGNVGTGCVAVYVGPRSVPCFCFAFICTRLLEPIKYKNNQERPLSLPFNYVSKSKL